MFSPQSIPQLQHLQQQQQQQQLQIQQHQVNSSLSQPLLQQTTQINSLLNDLMRLLLVIVHRLPISNTSMSIGRLNRRILKQALGRM